ncbi:MAG: PKD domain-containing protein [bacterium]
MRKYALPAALLGGLMSCSDLPTAPVTQQLASPSELSFDVSHVPIPGQYIVLFRSNGATALSNSAIVSNLYGGTVDRVYSSAINGAAMTLSDSGVVALRLDSRVLSVEQDEVIRKDATTQFGATWGLDRIDQRSRPLSGSYVYGANGNGVTVYILDTGINFSQADFGGRAVTGYDAITTGGTAVDCEGHGSHVAGTVGSTTYGVAKNVRLVAVRVLDCLGNGSSSSVLAGIDWVTTHRTLPAVANMSIGAGYNATVNLAVQSSIAAGVTYAVSAGNNSADACMQSPASAPDALTIGATDAGDAFAGFSNYGTCVDLLAPGVNVTSWWTGSGTSTLSGTSMSSPHVAGAAALYLQVNPTATPAQVRAALIGNATSGIVTGLSNGTPNLLLYIGFIQAPSAPVADFTSSCVSVACSFDASSSVSTWGTPSYNWTFGDASSGSGKTPTHTYATAGTYAVTLTITDPNGTSTKTKNVVINRAPTAAITSPVNNASYVQGASVTFTGTGTDPEDGTLSGVSLVWSSSKDGVIGTGASVATSTLSAGTHSITLTAKDSQGATGVASVTVTVTINQPPTATIVLPINNASFTPGASVSFTGSGVDPEDGVLTAGSLVWTSSRDGQIGTGVTFSASSLSVGSHTITLTAKDSRNATATATRSITIASSNQPPVAQFTASCPTTQCTLDASGSTDNLGILTYTWNWGDGRSENKAQPIAKNTWATNGIYTITLTVTSIGGLTNSIAKQVAVPGVPPTVTITAPGSGDVFPQGGSVSFVGSATDSDGDALVGSSLVWTSSVDGQLGVGATTSSSTLTPGVHTITLTATDALGITGTAMRTITITPANQAPTATIAAPANNKTFLAGSTVTFIGAGSDPEDGTLGGASLVWTSSRDGQIGTGASMSTSTLTAGTHLITLTVKDSHNAAGVASISIVINRPPSVSISSPAPNASVAAGTSVTFSGSATDPEDGVLSGTSMVWTSSRDGQIGTGVSFATTSLSIGAHIITLTAKDAQNAAAVVTRNITVTMSSNHAPVANFTMSCPTLHCEADANSSTDDVGVVSYSWDWGNGKSKTVTTPGTTTTFSAPGVYSVTLTVADAGGLTNTIVKQIAVGNQSPSATIASPSNNASFLQGVVVTLSGSATDPEDGVLSGASLAWRSSRDGVIGVGVSVSTASLSVGTHAISLLATDAQGAVDTATVTITIVTNQAPTAAIAAPTNNAVFLRGSSVAFSGAGNDPEDGVLNGASLVWRSSRDGQLGIGSAFATSSLSVGTHTITLTATDSRGATAMASITLTVVTPPANHAPVATIVTPVNNGTYPPGVSILFVGTGIDEEDGVLAGGSLVWTSSRDGQIGTGATFSTNALTPGVHTITLTVRDSQNATDTMSVSMLVRLPLNRPPTANIASPTTLTNFDTHTVTLTVKGAKNSTAVTTSVIPITP